MEKVTYIVASSLNEVVDIIIDARFTYLGQEPRVGDNDENLERRARDIDEKYAKNKALEKKLEMERELMQSKLFCKAIALLC